ncbi:DUF3592 domain-containing protein [Micromonospora sp. NPDC004551]|uniref:DUF3592 domain-containing protein n=1 Tax=Micromonospora sp. NPDC004551 TaxID=3154284 RepID=UPI00339F21B9
MAKRKAGATAPADTGWWRTGLMASVFLLLGAALVVGSILCRWQLSERADRLRSEGVPVTATVTDRAGGGGRGSGIDRIEIYYMYGPAQYHTWIPCAGVTGCHSTPEPELTVWVDPAEPERFVAENGHTDGSLSFLMSWTTIPMGGAFAAVGGAGLGLVLHVKRSGRASANQPSQGRRGRGGRRR